MIRFWCPPASLSIEKSDLSGTPKGFGIHEKDGEIRQTVFQCATPDGKIASQTDAFTPGGQYGWNTAQPVLQYFDDRNVKRGKDFQGFHTLSTKS